MNKKIIILGVAGLLAFACGEDDAENKGNKPVKKQHVDDRDTTDSEDLDMDTNSGVDHRLPTPSLFFEVISEIGGEADMALVNPVSNVENYKTPEYKALNFGVYFADFGYMYNYDSNTALAEYLQAMKTLADELSISSIFSEDIINKASEYSENADSVYSYQNDVYYNAYNYLEQEDKADVLSYMLIGGWVESMYIVINLAGEYSENNQLIDKIAEQSVPLESIMMHVVNSTEKDPKLEEWADKLGELYNLYLENTVTSDNTQEMNNGKLVVSGGDKVVLDEEAFGTIVEKIEEMRSEIIEAD